MLRRALRYGRRLYSLPTLHQIGAACALLVAADCSCPCYSDDAALTAPVDYVPRGGFESKRFQHAIPVGLETPAHYRFDKRFQSGLNCGPNALFVMLRLCNVWVTYDEVNGRVRVGPRGSTLKELADAAQSLGLPAVPRTNLSPDAIREAAKPLILHLNVTPTDVQPQRRDHFIVITHSAEGGGFSGVDTTNGLYTRFSEDFIVRNMTGHALVLNRSSVASKLSAHTGLLSVLFAMVLGANVLLFCASRRKHMATFP